MNRQLWYDQQCTAKLRDRVKGANLLCLQTLKNDVNMLNEGIKMYSELNQWKTLEDVIRLQLEIMISNQYAIQVMKTWDWTFVYAEHKLHDMDKDIDPEKNEVNIYTEY